MAADQVALVLVSGQPRRIDAGDTLKVGVGIKSTAGGGLSVGEVGETTTFPGNLQVDGTLTVITDSEFQTNAHFTGNVEFGDATTDDITFTGSVVTDLYFKHTSPTTLHTISGRAPTANTGTAGNDVTLSSATGAAAGAAQPGGAGGYTTVESGTGGAGSADNSGGDGGDTTVKGGTGGVGASQTSGAGGKLILNGGNAGTVGTVAGNNGGRVEIDGGLASGGGVNGEVWVGTNGGTDAVDIGRTGKDTTVLGNLVVDEAAHLHGSVQLGDAAGDDLTFGGSIPGSVYFKHDTTDHFLTGRAPAANTGTAGDNLVIRAATGAASGAANAGGLGGNTSAYGGVGGAADTNNVGGGGGMGAFKGGTGGAGHADQISGAGGDVYLEGGPAGADGGAGGNNGGGVYIDGGTKTGAGTVGSINVGTQRDVVVTINGSSVTLQEAGTDALILDGGEITVQNTFTLLCEAGGMIDLPANFEIAGDAVSNNVTANNLDELTGGGSTTLHSHASSPVALTVTCNVTTRIEAGAPVSMDNVSGSPKAFMAKANGATANRENAIGIAPSIIATGATGDVYTTGEVAVPDAQWDALPAVGDVGKKAYLSATNAGNLTLTAPDTTGQYVLKMGIVTVGGTGAVKVAIQIGDSFLV